MVIELMHQLRPPPSGCRQVNIDCDFLKRERIMDYSLLIGIHFRNTTCERDVILARPINSQENTVKDENFSSRAQDSKSLGVDMLARAELTGRPDDGLLPTGRPIEEIYDVSISFGIIDILQDYDISKKLEHAYKSMQYDAALISAVDPRQYSRRFCDFIFKVFVEEV
ncbi:hypothetical protein MLD38_002748 [Melastoma candidum]|uniref:Uncharacterized protein n=1 Tax=Melastoma candidum TaxID=119954 RepID=A0ACB9S0D8_9MYRT|nr:hypothetical protein MLD38_002748 [Melastoma candidum]